MTYCNARWVSDYTWERIRAKHPVASVAAQALSPNVLQANGEYLMVSGIISITQNAATLSPFYRLSNLPEQPLPIPGNYAIRLLDGGTLLASYPVSVTAVADTEENAEEFSPLVEVVPYITGTTRIEITNGAQLIAARLVSSNTPTATITYPRGGETLTGTVPITWTANDADGDPLYFTILYSVDDGQTWIPVETDIATTTYELDTTKIAGSSQARLLVLASDGVNTGQATSAVFQVMRKGPTSAIIAPENGSTYPPDEPLRLQGAAWDEEDGYLSDGAFGWTDDVSGALGTGAVLTVPALTPGWHTLTLAAQDSDNMTGTATVTVFIGSTFYVHLPIIER